MLISGISSSEIIISRKRQQESNALEFEVYLVIRIMLLPSEKMFLVRCALSVSNFKTTISRKRQQESNALEFEADLLRSALYNI